MVLGAWRLNPELSDDGRAKLREAARRMPTREDSPGGAFGGGGTSGRRGGGGRAGSGGLRGREAGGVTGSSEEALAIGEFVAPAASLELGGVADEVVVSAGAAAPARLRTDHRWRRREDGTEIRAQWDGASLIVESKADAGPRTRTTYHVRSGQGQLEVLSRLELASGVVASARRVYEPAPPSDPAPGPSPRDSSPEARRFR